jgi:hypothetical protein
VPACPVSMLSTGRPDRSVTLTDSSFQSNFLSSRPSEKVEKTILMWQRPLGGCVSRSEVSLTQDEAGRVTAEQEAEEVGEGVLVGTAGTVGATAASSGDGGDSGSSKDGTHPSRRGRGTCWGSGNRPTCRPPWGELVGGR